MVNFVHGALKMPTIPAGDGLKGLLRNVLASQARLSLRITLAIEWGETGQSIITGSYLKNKKWEAKGKQEIRS